MTLAQIQRLTEYCASDIVTTAQYVQGAPEMFDLSNRLIPPMQQALYRFLDGFVASSDEE